MRITMILLLLLTASPAFAACLDDGSGERICGVGPCEIDESGQVFCAPHEQGSVMFNDSGEIVCGWGQCARGPYGGNYCAIDPGGAITLDEHGGIACVGGCEAAHAGLCAQDKQKIEI